MSNTDFLSLNNFNELYKNITILIQNSNNFSIDTNPKYKKILKQLMELVERAEKSGAAIGIGHVKLKTLHVLEEEIPKLQKKGFVFEFVSNMLH